MWFCVGAFFAFPDFTGLASGLNLLGVKIGVMIYDVIPYSHPEYCDVNTPNVFHQSVGTLARLTDFAICISAFTEREIRRALSEIATQSLPTTVVRLGSDGDARGHDLKGATRSESTHRGFILCVGTIEARKNHVYLFRVWQDLIKDLGDDIPDLVIAGRRGWRVDSFFYQLDATRNLDGRILVINDATDADLAHLYDGCLFTVFPSFVEGWGLPVGESLAHGKLCVASGTSSIPEVGGDLALYIDPLNVRDGVEVIGGLLRDRDRLEALTERVRREFRPRSWATFSSELLEAVDRLSSGPRREFRPVVLRERTWLRFARPHSVSETRDEGGGAVNATAACVSGWHGAEDWGRWTTESGGRLVFRLASPGRYVMVFGYNLPSGVGARAVRITHDGEVRFDGVVAGPHGVVAIETPTAEDGLVEIVFSGRGARLGSDDTDLRAVLLGLSRLFVYRTDTLEQRVMGMQDMQLQTLQIA